MRIGIRERAQSVVIFLASGIPQGQLNVLSVYLDIGDVVLKHSWDVDLLLCVSPSPVSVALLRGPKALGADRCGIDKGKSSLHGCSYLWESTLGEDTV